MYVVYRPSSAIQTETDCIRYHFNPIAVTAGYAIMQRWLENYENRTNKRNHAIAVMYDKLEMA